MLYMLDFGLVKMYRNPATGEHTPYRDGLISHGSPRFTSHNTHLGIEPSRRDDMEALACILLNFYHGRLPWQGIYAPDIVAKQKRMGEMKAAGGKVLTEFLASSKPEFARYLEHVKNLGFTDEPDYGYLKALFADELHSSPIDCMGKDGRMTGSMIGCLMGRHFRLRTIDSGKTCSQISRKSMTQPVSISSAKERANIHLACTESFEINHEF